MLDTHGGVLTGTTSHTIKCPRHDGHCGKHPRDVSFFFFKILFIYLFDREIEKEH